MCGVSCGEDRTLRCVTSNLPFCLKLQHSNIGDCDETIDMDATDQISFTGEHFMGNVSALLGHRQ